jgi:aspartyl-tRNA(Asn)/glutamyl-tRNA(Gln) amidotransferase subunit A
MTMPGDLLSGALIEVARDLREKRVTARELIEAAIARYERFGERLHAYSLWAPEQARAVAAAADAAFSAGVTVGPLQGLPISIKDLFAASGYPCFAGSSRRLPSDPWEQDGPHHRAAQAGSVFTEDQHGTSRVSESVTLSLARG